MMVVQRMKGEFERSSYERSFAVNLIVFDVNEDGVAARPLCL